MASITSEDEGSDFGIQNVNANKSKKKLNIILSGEEGSNQDDIFEVVKETRVSKPTAKKSTKKKNQLSLLSFAQKKVAVSVTHPTPVSSQKSVQDKTECPICFKSIPMDKIEVHADSCADDTSSEVLDILSSQENQSSDFLDSDIFETEVTTKLPKRRIASSSTPSAKRPSWDLENSFDKPAGSTTSNLSKRKKSTAPSTLMVNDVERKQYDLAPYPEFNESKMRGCLRYTGNNPGTSIQNILKKKPVSPVKSAFQTEENLSSKGKTKSAGSSNSFGFKLHPFLAQASSSSTSNDSESLKGALVPDGEGGFIINDSVLDNADSDGDEPFSLPPLMSNGFIDFQNQFKESSTPSTKKRKTKSPKKSPRKKKWRQWQGRGRGGRGGGRNRRG